MTCLHLSRRARNSGQALIGLLLAVVILIGLYLLFLAPRGNNDGTVRKSIAKESIDRGHDVATNDYVRQIQLTIEQYKADNDGKPPASYEELRKYDKDFPDEMWIDPVTHKKLVYDATTGTISNPPANAPAPAAPNAPGIAVAPAAPAPPAAPGGIKIPAPQSPPADMDQ